MASYIGRAVLNILGALGKFNSSRPPKAIHAEAIVHYLTIYMQHINTQLYMHAHAYNINIVCKKYSKLRIATVCILLFLQVILYAIIRITKKLCFEL